MAKHHDPRYIRARNESRDADQQPWRCVECGEAVSHVRHNDCACIRKMRAEQGVGAQP